MKKITLSTNRELLAEAKRTLQLLTEDAGEEWGVDASKIKKKGMLGGKKEYDGDLILKKKVADLKEFQKLFSIHTVTGKFVCSGLGLTSLEGSPEEVTGCFDCSHNNLENLEGGPETVKGNYLCMHNKLKSLQGVPLKLPKMFCINSNQLTNDSLEDGPQYVGMGYYCGKNAEPLKKPRRTRLANEQAFMADKDLDNTQMKCE